MKKINPLVHDYHWTPAQIKSFAHFTAIVKGWGVPVSDEEISEAYELITGKKAPEKKPTKNNKK